VFHDVDINAASLNALPLNDPLPKQLVQDSISVGQVKSAYADTPSDLDTDEYGTAEDSDNGVATIFTSSSLQCICPCKATGPFRVGATILGIS
jgi:hypothetical protein